MYLVILNKYIKNSTAERILCKVRQSKSTKAITVL